MHASLAQYVVSATSTFKRSTQVGTPARYGIVSVWKKIFRKLNSTDETREFNRQEMTEFAVCWASLNRQLHANESYRKQHTEKIAHATHEWT